MTPAIPIRYVRDRRSHPAWKRELTALAQSFPVAFERASEAFVMGSRAVLPSFVGFVLFLVLAFGGIASCAGGK